MTSKVSRRDFLRISAGATLGTLLSACAPAAAPTTPQVIEKVVTVEVAKKEPVTLNFFNRGGEYIAKVMDTQMKLYQESHPEISFEINAVPGYSHQEVLLMMFAAGTGPDVWFDANRTTGMLTRKGLTVNLEPFLAADPKFNEDDYIPNCWIAQTYDGARWGLPWDSGAMVVAFNMDLFDESGIPYPDPQKWMTWDEIVELGKELTIDLDGKRANDPGFDPSRVKQYGFIADRGHGRQTYIWSNNAEIIEADLSCPVDTPEFIEAMNWLADLGLKHYVGPSPAYEQATTMDIRSKNVAIQHIGVWLLGRINDAGVTRWGTMQVPYSKTKVSYGHYSPLCISSKSQHKQEAYDFIFFACCSYEGEKILVDMGMQQPIRKDLRDRFINNPAPPEPKYRQVFYDAFEGPTFRWPGDKVGSYYNGWYQPMIDLWAPYLDQLWSGQVRWEDVATEVRQKTEHLMRTGEVT